MQRARARTETVQPEIEGVECTTCGLTMSSQLGSGGQVRYFHCARCQRWCTSFYQEALTGQAGMRPCAPAPARPAPPDDVQARIASWLKALALA